MSKTSLKLPSILGVGLLVLNLFYCQKNDDNKDLENLILLNLLTPRPKPAPPELGVVQNVKVESTTTRKVVITWDEFPSAVVYNIYYTCSPNPPSSVVPSPDTVANPAAVQTTTGAVTSNGITTGTQTCANDVVNIVKKAESPFELSLSKLGIPYKFIVTAFIDVNTETAPSEVAVLPEPVPTLAQRMRGIYMVGGLSGQYSSPIAAVDMYDPDTAIWYPSITNLPTPVSFAGVASERSKIVVVGGFNVAGNVSNLTQIYDIPSDTWTNGLPGPASTRANLGASNGNGNGKLYFLGGTTTAAGTAFAGSTATDIYDVVTNSWSVGTAFGAAGSERAVVNLNGILYNNGGRTAAATPAVTHDGYVISANALTSGIEVVLSTARSGHSLVGYSTNLNSEIWTIGGFTAITGQTASGLLIAGTTALTLSTLVQTLSSPFTAPAAWTATPPQLPVATMSGAAVVDPRNGNVYYSGGNQNSAAPLNPIGVTQFLSSNIVTKIPWNALAPLPTGRWGHSAVIPTQ